jgi:hypothetical protein
MKTAAALDHIERFGGSFANRNPHWWIGKDGDGFWCDYSYCNDPDCSCYQHDPQQSREELLKQFPDDEWDKST